MKAASVVRRLYGTLRVAARNVERPDHYPELAFRIGLAGLLARHIEDPALAVDPGYLVAHRLHDTLLIENAHTVHEALGRAGIPHVFAKGIALLGDRGPYRPGDRVISDVDLYVPLPTRKAAVAALRRGGYLPLPAEEQPGPPELRSALTLARIEGTELERVTIDCHWGLDPVERLLPRRDRGLPAPMWDRIDRSADLPRPAPEDHATILTHHLVHTDLLHVRSLFDLAFVLDGMDPDAVATYHDTCRDLRIGMFAHAVSVIIERDIGIGGGTPAGQPPEHWTEFLRSLTLERWLTLIATIAPHEEGEITTRRIRRRLQLIDQGGAGSLARDVFLPPVSFLRWRWPDRSLGQARLAHLRQLARKLLSAAGRGGKR